MSAVGRAGIVTDEEADMYLVQDIRDRFKMWCCGL